MLKSQIGVIIKEFLNCSFFNCHLFVQAISFSFLYVFISNEQFSNFYMLGLHHDIYSLEFWKLTIVVDAVMMLVAK